MPCRARIKTKMHPAAHSEQHPAAGRALRAKRDAAGGKSKRSPFPRCKSRKTLQKITSLLNHRPIHSAGAPSRLNLMESKLMRAECLLASFEHIFSVLSLNSLGVGSWP